MPRKIEHFHSAKLVSIKKLNDIHRPDSVSRKEYIGHHGELFVLESQQRSPGSRYVYFTNHDNIRLTTGFGSYTVEKNRLTMKTHNSIYEFELL
jgi:hypothetical protein